ncbi:diphthine--ammonia ligase isoform X3 [Ictidomys tridecemlineatus]
MGSDELDSYMYQTVGHQAIDLYAEAMALPLYRRTIRGRSLDIGQVYTKCEGDEVEDLYELLKLVKEKEEVDGISVGAILSDYQHARVQNVCKRLNLQLLAYLWQRNQEDLLREMIASNIQAVIIKVAALGLDPDKHLGKTLDEMEPYLLELSKKYGVHVCGEGGEYETFTLDCPLFKKKIIVDSSEVVVHSADAFAPVAYLRFLELHLEDKNTQDQFPQQMIRRSNMGNTLPWLSSPNTGLMGSEDQYIQSDTPVVEVLYLPGKISLVPYTRKLREDSMQIGNIQ